MKRRRFALVLFAVVTLIGGSSVFAADNVSSKLDYHVADAFIQNATGIPQTGAVATASANGHQVRVSGSGTFNVSSMKATGSGTFVHTDASGDVQGFGTWKATAVHSATLYPCGGPGLPDNACGGVIVLWVRLSATSTSLGALEVDALLTIDCEINPPTAGAEGVKLDIPGFLNFDRTEESFGGLTVFVSRNR